MAYKDYYVKHQKQPEMPKITFTISSDHTTLEDLSLVQPCGIL